MTRASERPTIAAHALWVGEDAMDTPLLDGGGRTSGTERRGFGAEEPALDRADLLWTVFGAAVLVTFLSLAVAHG
jgi:hypothetical protein